jgi:iron complex transport system substrate-binding protein
MKIFKKICVALLCLGMVATFAAGCGSGTTNDNEKDDDVVSGGESNSGVVDYSPVVIVDQADRRVVIENDPTTIVSSYYISTSMLIALGEQENIKGIESKGTGYRPIYELVGMDTSTLGGYGTKKKFETEKAAELSPDLIVIPYSLKDSADTISETLSAPVIVVNPESDSLMRYALNILGQATRQEERAKQLITYIDNTLLSMQDDVDSSTPSTYFVSSSGLLVTANSTVYQNTMIENAVATNVAYAEKETTISYETLNLYNPDVIIIASESKVTVEDVLADPEISSINAVVNSKVYKMPYTYEAWDSPVPAAFLGSLYLAANIHTGYTIADYEATCKDFYKTFYGIDA